MKSINDYWYISVFRSRVESAIKWRTIILMKIKLNEKFWFKKRAANENFNKSKLWNGTQVNVNFEYYENNAMDVSYINVKTELRKSTFSFRRKYETKTIQWTCCSRMWRTEIHVIVHVLVHVIFGTHQREMKNHSDYFFRHFIGAPSLLCDKVYQTRIYGNRTKPVQNYWNNTMVVLSNNVNTKFLHEQVQEVEQDGRRLQNN